MEDLDFFTGSNRLTGQITRNTSYQYVNQHDIFVHDPHSRLKTKAEDKKLPKVIDGFPFPISSPQNSDNDPTYSNNILIPCRSGDGAPGIPAGSLHKHHTSAGDLSGWTFVYKRRYVVADFIDFSRSSCFDFYIYIPEFKPPKKTDPGQFGGFDLQYYY